jgi:dihydrofolate synthase/folylpolyglutamate synthase
VPNQPRATGNDELEKLVPADFCGACVRSALIGLFPGGDRCAVGGADDVVVVTGSIYLLGEVMAQLQQ